MDTDDITVLEEQVRAAYASGRLSYDLLADGWFLDGEVADEITTFTVERLNVAGDLTRLRPLS
jgi:hypothetical protein